MSDVRVKERLERLVATGICSIEDADKCAAELEKLAVGVDLRAMEEHSKFFKALSDSMRLRMLKLLETREMCVCEVMFALELTQPTASYHLGILERVGLVKGRKRGKWVFYSIANQKLIEALHKAGLL